MTKVVNAPVKGVLVADQGSNDVEGSGKVLLRVDETGDSDYLDAGEAAILATNAFDGTSLFRPCAVDFYEGPVQNVDTSLGAGNHDSLFRDRETNTVYAAGENLFGQLAQGVAGFDVPAPRPVALPDGFNAESVCLSAGLIHAGFLTDEGDVDTSGFGDFGRLGLGDEEDRQVPEKITGDLDDETVVVLDLGNGASYTITDDGALYAWGQNSNGELGLGDEAERLVPTRVAALAGETIVAVSSGTSHTLALTADGEVYGWGSNVDGQVGDPGRCP